MPNGSQVKTFQRMNQDVDPRFLPEGAYVSADNFRVGQIKEGTMSVQSVDGNINTELSIPDSGVVRCVGLFDDKRNSKLYTFIYNHRYIDNTITLTTPSTTLTTFTVTGGHGLSEYDNVVFYGVSGADAADLEGRTFIATSVTATTFQIELDSSTGSPTYVFTNAILFTSPHQIIELDYLNSKETLVIRSHFLEFSLNNPIRKIDVAQNLMSYTDGVTEPKTFNFVRAISGDYPQDGSNRTVWRKDYLTTAKYMPHFPMYTGRYQNASQPNNAISQKAYQFRCRWVYKDGQRSAFSPISIVVSGGDESNVGQFNTIRVKVPFLDNLSDSEQVITQVYYAEQSGLGSQNAGNWYLFEEYDRRTTNRTITSTPSTNNEALPKFYYQYYIDTDFTGNTRGLIVTDADDLAALNDGVPRAANSQAIIESNRPVYGGTLENFDLVKIDLTNKVEFFADANSDRSYNPKHGARSLLGIVYFDEFMRQASIQTVTVEDASTTGLITNEEGHSQPYIPYWGETRNATTTNSGGLEANANGKARIQMRIRHDPPEWAKYFNIVYGGNDKVSTFFQTPSPVFEYYNANGVKQTALSLRVADDNVINKGFQTLNYEFSKGDRVRIRYIDSNAGTIPASYLDYDIQELKSNFWDFGQSLSLVPGTGVVQAVGYLPEFGTYVFSVGEGPLTPLQSVVKGEQVRFSGITNAPIASLMNGKVFTVLSEDYFGNTLFACDQAFDTTLAAASYTVAGANAQYEIQGGQTQRAILINDASATLTADVPAIEVYTPAQGIASNDEIIWKETSIWGDIYTDLTNKKAHRIEYDGFTNNTAGTDNVTRSQFGANPAILDIWFDDIESSGSTTDNSMYILGTGSYMYDEVLKTNVGAIRLYEFRDIMPTEDSKSFSVGRQQRLVENFSEDFFSTRLRWGQPTLNLKSTNGINKFYDLDLKDLATEFGAIEALDDLDRSLTVMQTDKIGIIPVSQYQVDEQTGAAIIGKTKEVLSDIIYSPLNYGLSGGANSWDEFNSTYFFQDPKRGIIGRMTGTQMQEISLNGMSKYFKELFNLSSGFQAYEEYSNFWRNLTVVDKENEETIFSIARYGDYTPTFVVSGGVLTFSLTFLSQFVVNLPEGLSADVTIFDSNGNEALFYTGTTNSSQAGTPPTTTFEVDEIDSADIASALNAAGVTSGTARVVIKEFQQTIAYSDINEGFTSFYSFMPDAMSQFGYNFATSKDGQTWVHFPQDQAISGQNTLVANFYGTTYNSKLKFAGNQSPAEEKTWSAMRTQMRILDASNQLDTDIQMSAEHVTQQGQKTTNIKEDFEYHEGYFDTAIFRDENTPNMGQPKYNGDQMKDSALITELEYDNTYQDGVGIGRRVVNILNVVYEYSKSFF